MAEAIETLNIDLLRPFDIEMGLAGSGTDSRNNEGWGASVDMAGGGLTTCKYVDCKPGNVRPAALLYLSRLGAMLEGSVAAINVPVKLDFIAPLTGPLNGIGSLYRTVTHSDGTAFSDGTRYRQATISAIAAEAVEYSQSVIKIRMVEGADLRGGEWFSINHPVRGHRAYRIRKVYSKSSVDRIFEVAIRPTLREDVTAMSYLRFVRPLCQMTLKPKTTRSQCTIGMAKPKTTLPVKVKGFWMGSADIEFLEASPQS